MSDNECCGCGCIGYHSLECPYVNDPTHKALQAQLAAAQDRHEGLRTLYIRAVRRKNRVNSELQTQLAAALEREGAMREVVKTVADATVIIHSACGDSPNLTIYNRDIKKVRELKAKAQALLAAPAPGEFVAVKVMDLEVTLRDWELDSRWNSHPETTESYNRLKAALAQGKEKP